MAEESFKGRLFDLLRSAENLYGSPDVMYFAPVKILDMVDRICAELVALEAALEHEHILTSQQVDEALQAVRDWRVRDALTIAESLSLLSNKKEEEK